MNTIPSFYKGEHLTVRRMQEIADAVNQLLGLQGDGLIQVHGNRLTLNVDGLLARIPKGAPAVSIVVYEATADESEGEITGKTIDSAGALTGDELTFKVLPE